MRIWRHDEQRRPELASATFLAELPARPVRVEADANFPVIHERAVDISDFMANCRVSSPGHP